MSLGQTFIPVTFVTGTFIAGTLILLGHLFYRDIGRWNIYPWVIRPWDICHRDIHSWDICFTGTFVLLGHPSPGHPYTVPPSPGHSITTHGDYASPYGSPPLPVIAASDFGNLRLTSAIYGSAATVPPPLLSLGPQSWANPNTAMTLQNNNNAFNCTLLLHSIVCCLFVAIFMSSRWQIP